MERHLKLFIIILLTMSDGCQSRVTKRDVEEDRKNRTASLPIPNLKYMKIENPAHITVRWDPVEVSKNNPILGFKVKLWEDVKIKSYRYVEKDGKQEMVEEWLPVDKPSSELPTHKPAFESVVAPDVFSTSFDVKYDEHYELSAQSYSVDGDGPLSKRYGFKLHCPREKQTGAKNETNKI